MRQVGLVIGRSAGGRSCLLQCIKCPEQDGKPPIQMKNTSDKKRVDNKALILDGDWIVEHAIQVCRLLPGGIHVMGLYFLIDEAALNSSNFLIISLLKNLMSECIEASCSGCLVYVNSRSRKPAVKELASVSCMSLSHCETKVVDVRSQFVSIDCFYQLQTKIYMENDQKKLKDSIKDAVHYDIETRVASSIGVLGDEMATESESIQDFLVHSGKGSVISLVGPFQKSSIPAKGVGNTQQVRVKIHSIGDVALCGTIHGRALVHKRETAVAAIDALKADLKDTLLCRLAALCELDELTHGEGLDSLFEQQLNALQSRQEITLPRRVFVLGSSPLCYCDYIMEGEREEAVLERLQELVGLQGGEVECKEVIGSQARKGNGNKRGSYDNGNLMVGGVIAALIAILFGLMLLMAK